MGPNEDENLAAGGSQTSSLGVRFSTLALVQSSQIDTIIDVFRVTSRRTFSG